MRRKREALAECGRILKQVAPKLGITISELESRFSVEISKITKTKITKERIHKLFCGEPWPIEFYGFHESNSAIEAIAKSILGEGALYERKKREINQIVSIAFTDYDHLSYFISGFGNQNTYPSTTDIAERIMNDVSKIKDDKFLYILYKYLKAFLSISFFELDVLSLGIKFDQKWEIPVSIQSGFKLFADPVLRQWLSLRNNNHSDAFRKVKGPQLEKMRNSLREQLAGCGIMELASLTCFIEEFILEKKQNIWSNAAKDYLDKILVCKYIIGANEQCVRDLEFEILKKKGNKL